MTTASGAVFTGSWQGGALHGEAEARFPSGQYVCPLFFFYTERCTDTHRERERDGQRDTDTAHDGAYALGCPTRVCNLA